MKSELPAMNTMLYDIQSQKGDVQNANEVDISKFMWAGGYSLMPPTSSYISNPFSVHMYGFIGSFL